MHNQIMYFRCQIQNYMSINSNFYSYESKLKVWESLGLAHSYIMLKNLPTVLLVRISLIYSQIIPYYSFYIFIESL